VADRVGVDLPALVDVEVIGLLALPRAERYHLVVRGREVVDPQVGS
jgi:hypothetical protein